MIENQNDVTELESINKIYIPGNLKNQNYSYRFNGDYIIIITNNNCYQNYNTTYCDCYSYNYKNNVTSESYACNITSNSTQTIPYSSISNDINYSSFLKEQYYQKYGLILLMFILAISFAKWLTRERSCL